MTAYPEVTYETIQHVNPSAVVLPYTPRANWTPLLFLPSIFFCGASWAAQGIPILTDVGFIGLTLVCFALLIGELRNFTRRFGVGGIVLYGGFLIWFCQDYCTNWVGINFSFAPWPPVVVAKAAFMHSLFLMMMSVGLLWQIGHRMESWILVVPDFPSRGVAFAMVLILFSVGISPYFWDVKEPFYQAIPMAITAGRSNAGPHFIYGRTANIATGWESYIGHIVELGSFAGLLAVAYALLIARSFIQKGIAWSIWVFETALGFGSGTRGEIVFVALPVIALMFIKYHALAASRLKKFSLRAYATVGVLGFLILVLVQIQGTFRNAGFTNASLNKVSIFKNQGNNMFSEALDGYRLIPDKHPFFYDAYFGEAIFRPVPQTLFLMITHPIPRVIWSSKPIDPLGVWHSETHTGENSHGGAVGTTIAVGLVGDFYFKYAIAGVLEGGMLMGWLMGMSERWLRASEGRVFPMLTSLGIATWLFRCFRGFTYGELWTMLLGVLAASIVFYLVRIVVPPEGQHS